MLTCHSRQRFINGACFPLTEVLLFAHYFNIMANWDTLNSRTVVSSSLGPKCPSGSKQQQEERGRLASVLIKSWLVSSMLMLNFSGEEIQQLTQWGWRFSRSRLGHENKQSCSLCLNIHKFLVHVFVQCVCPPQATRDCDLVLYTAGKYWTPDQVNL